MSKKTSTSRLRLMTAFFVSAMLIVACLSLPGQKAANEKFKVGTGFGSAELTYQPNTHIIEREEGMAALKAVSKDGSTLLFESENPKLKSLEAGDVLLIKGLLARKVVAVDIQGSQIAVLTQDAGLGDAIQQGHIQVDAPISFTQSPDQKPPAPRRVGRLESPSQMIVPSFLPTAYAQSPDAEKAKKAESQGETDAAKSLAKGAIKGVFEGWDTTFSATPSPGKLNISIKLTKDVGGFRAVITGEGYIENFDLSSSIDIDQGVVQQLKMLQKKLNGIMNFKWEVAKDTPGEQTGNDRIKLPAAISIPLYQYLGGLPLFLEVSAAILIKPAISGGKEYSRGAFRITYNGYQGFQAKEGNLDADGHVTGDIQFLESQNISALAPLGMVVAFAAPRIELSFGVSKIIKSDQLKAAAEKVDLIADQLMKRVLEKDDYERFKSSPLNFKIGKAVENAMGSDAAAYIELVTSAGMSHTGMSVITPCTRTDLHLWIKVGASAQAFGQLLGGAGTDIFKKDFTRIDPPGTKLCEEIEQ